MIDSLNSNSKTAGNRPRRALAACGALVLVLGVSACGEQDQQTESTTGMAEKGMQESKKAGQEAMQGGKQAGKKAMEGAKKSTDKAMEKMGAGPAAGAGKMGDKPTSGKQTSAPPAPTSKTAVENPNRPKELK